jgi:hypothetical protein
MQRAGESSKPLRRVAAAAAAAAAAAVHVLRVRGEIMGLITTRTD